jgi:hypothetical protein
MSDIADKIYAATGLTLGAEAAAAIGQMIQAENENLQATLNFAVTSHHEAVNTVISLVAERDTLRAALQWLVNDLQDYPASARPIAAYDNARTALGEKE